MEWEENFVGYGSCDKNEFICMCFILGGGKGWFLFTLSLVFWKSLRENIYEGKKGMFDFIGLIKRLIVVIGFFLLFWLWFYEKRDLKGGLKLSCVGSNVNFR